MSLRTLFDILREVNIIPDPDELASFYSTREGRFVVSIPIARNQLDVVRDRLEIAGADLSTPGEIRIGADTEDEILFEFEEAQMAAKRRKALRVIGAAVVVLSVATWVFTNFGAIHFAIKSAL